MSVVTDTTNHEIGRTGDWPGVIFRGMTGRREPVHSCNVDLPTPVSPAGGIVSVDFFGEPLRRETGTSIERHVEPFFEGHLRTLWDIGDIARVGDLMWYVGWHGAIVDHLCVSIKCECRGKGPATSLEAVAEPPL